MICLKVENMITTLYEENVQNRIEPLAEHSRIGSVYRIIREVSRNEVFIFYDAFNEKDGNGCILAEFCPDKFISGREFNALKIKSEIASEDYSYMLKSMRLEVSIHMQEKGKKGIADILDYAMANNTIYISYKLSDYKPLSDVYSVDKPSYSMIIESIMDLMVSLLQLHAEGIFHTGISPECLFINNDGKVCLVGFCESVSIREDGIIFSRRYPYNGIADDAVYSDCVCDAADAFSVAAVIFSLVTGEQIDKAMLQKKDVQYLDRLRKSLPANARKAIVSALTMKVDAGNKFINLFTALYHSESQSAKKINNDTTEQSTCGDVFCSYSNRDNHGKRKAFKIVLLFLSLLFVISGMTLIALYAFTGSKHGIMNGSNSIAAPNLVGDEIESARKKLDEYNAGLEISIISAEYDDLIPAGTIQSQIPEYGTIINKNTSIEVILSRGKEEDIASGAVPFLLGISMDEAERQLRELGYEVTITERHDQIYAKGTVCETNPEANTALEQGETVELVISLGAIVTGVQIEPTSTEIETGSTMQLSVIIEPANAENKTVTWTSSDPSIVTVDESGKITAGSSEGRAKITVTTEDGGHTAVCKVTVIKENVSPTSKPKPTSTLNPTPQSTPNQTTNPVPSPAPSPMPSPTPAPSPMPSQTPAPSPMPSQTPAPSPTTILKTTPTPTSSTPGTAPATVAYVESVVNTSINRIDLNKHNEEY